MELVSASVYKLAARIFRLEEIEKRQIREVFSGGETFIPNFAKISLLAQKLKGRAHNMAIS
jgi:hypothetical protein